MSGKNWATTITFGGDLANVLATGNDPGGTDITATAATFRINGADNNSLVMADNGNVQLGSGPGEAVNLAAWNAGTIDLNTNGSIVIAASGTAGVSLNGKLGFYGTAPIAKPSVPLIPIPQDIVDALVLVGLISQ